MQGIRFDVVVFRNYLGSSLSLLIEVFCKSAKDTSYPSVGFNLLVLFVLCEPYWRVLRLVVVPSSFERVRIYFVPFERVVPVVDLCLLTCF
jgi:hypothetical protein